MGTTLLHLHKSGLNFGHSCKSRKIVEFSAFDQGLLCFL